MDDSPRFWMRIIMVIMVLALDRHVILGRKLSDQDFSEKKNIFFPKIFFFLPQKNLGSIRAWESIQIIDFRCLAGLLDASGLIANGLIT